MSLMEIIQSFQSVEISSGIVAIRLNVPDPLIQAKSKVFKMDARNENHDPISDVFAKIGL